jgi:hypothetical protein
MTEMIPVESSNIRAVGWEADAIDADSLVEGEPEVLGKLTVEFVSGATYVFDDVPESEFDALRSAESIGRHFQANIRNTYAGWKQ